MTEKDLLEIFVLNEICDDYENLQHIEARIQPWSAEYGLSFSTAEIQQSLCTLLEAKLIAAYDLRELVDHPVAIEGSIPTEDLASLYYFLTADGIKHHQRNDQFFGDNGDLLEGLGFQKSPE